ncbi:peptidoglycan-binding protein [Halanaerocella petrolearia]
MRVKRIILLILVILLLSSVVLAVDKFPCGSLKYRPISLQSPPMIGDDIWELQRELKQLGFYKGELNSTYDSDTYLAVKKFQYQHQSSATGVVTRGTWLDLAKALDKESFIKASGKDLSSPTGEITLLVDGYKRQLKVFSDGELYHTFSVAIGKTSTRSPIGEWAIIRKDAHWGGGFGARWMGLNVPWGKYGIHGTNKPGSIGRAASHGCIRMYNRDVKILYSWVEVGTRVKIIGRRDPIEITHDLRSGQTGKDVLLLQEKLREYGFQPGYTDGRFGTSTKEAMQELKYLYGLQDDLVADKNIFYILDLK